MSDQAHADGSPMFLKAFLPGLVLGLLVGLAVGALVTPLLDRSPSLKPIPGIAKTPASERDAHPAPPTVKPEEKPAAKPTEPPAPTPAPAPAPAPGGGAKP